MILYYVVGVVTPFSPESGLQIIINVSSVHHNPITSNFVVRTSCSDRWLLLFYSSSYQQVLIFLKTCSPPDDDTQDDE